jgi:hypothetical protein
VASATASSGTSGAKAATPTPIYHGPAPGVEGLTRAIAKAHGAVATSQQNAQQLQRKSAEASNESPASAPATSKATPTNAVSATHNSSAATAPAHKAPVHAGSRSSVKVPGGGGAAEREVERELVQGKTVMLLFWNPKSSVDQEVRAQVAALVAGSKGAVRMHAALAHQVGMFGAITEVVHVYETPTILIVNRHGVVSTLTGLTDVFALEQAVREARSATR